MEVVEYGFQQASIAFQTGLVDLHPAVGRSLGKKIGRGKRRVAEEILLAGIADLRACSGRLGRLNIDGRSLGRGEGGTGRCRHGGAATFRSLAAQPASGQAETRTVRLLEGEEWPKRSSWRASRLCGRAAAGWGD